MNTYWENFMNAYLKTRIERKRKSQTQSRSYIKL